jgi:ElaB/YqjD/DUF883 family membrane-anchored ribosome-binding protein
MFSNRTTTRSPEELASAFNQLVDEGKALLGELMEKPQERTAKMRAVVDDMSGRFTVLQSSAGKIAQRSAKQGARYAREADRYLHDNPWPAIVGGIILGVLGTLWLSQRR